MTDYSNMADWPQLLQTLYRSSALFVEKKMQRLGYKPTREIFVSNKE